MSDLASRIEALERAQQPAKFIVLIEWLDKDQQPNNVSCEGRKWMRRARESVEDFHDRVVRDLGHPPHVFLHESDLDL